MSITYELREFTPVINGYKLMRPCDEKELLAIADRIDAEHESSMYDMRREHDEWVADRDAKWVKLPVDADGEVWHVGDFAIGEVNPKNPKAIERMIWYGPDSGWQLEMDTIIYPCPDRPRHYHAPTVEDVLDEIVDKANAIGVAYASNDMSGDEMMDALRAIIAEYAAMLRLAGDDA